MLVMEKEERRQLGETQRQSVKGIDTSYSSFLQQQTATLKAIEEHHKGYSLNREIDHLNV